MDCKQAASLMHEYLDKDLPEDQALDLKSHLDRCESCRTRFKELEQSEMLLFAAVKQSLPSTSDDVLERIMSNLPKRRRQQVWITWVKRHPAMTAAAVFLLVMLFSTLSVWKSDDQLVVKGADLDKVQIEGHTVIVPEGTAIAGDLTVENGNTEIYGEVKGNLTVIDGSLYEASTAKIAGDAKTIDQALDWIWYRITNTFTEVASR
ncbi:zf-HC2 domain-containing protein [Paenibacillus pinistramenti]|uniref:zf-HC2 domain-containing protein n=1 Tax=Paenibacillus pinistramenti TaxID=1768003 RepID=UPI0011096347|nr:zf-HC2 domain-containing protein [Paenibacillus pinistramenti]